ncbi:hypothetical protein [Methanosarcina spelaei]|nr:hypothetical protein [Methanosarcina spelaei]
MVEDSENLERATTISEAYLILESFNLTNEERKLINPFWCHKVYKV